MDKELTFYVPKDGQMIECRILAIVPSNESGISYVAFCDSIDEKNVQYAKIIKINDEYMIDEFENDSIVSELKNKIIDSINNEVSSIVENDYE